MHTYITEKAILLLNSLITSLYLHLNIKHKNENTAHAILGRLLFIFIVQVTFYLVSCFLKKKVA